MPQICPIHLCSSCVFSEIQLHALLNLCSCFCRSSFSGPECAALRFQNVCCLPRIIDLSRNILKECFIPRSIFFGQRNDRVNRAVYRKLRCKIGVVCVSGFIAAAISLSNADAVIGNAKRPSTVWLVSESRNCRNAAAPSV